MYDVVLILENPNYEGKSFAKLTMTHYARRPPSMGTIYSRPELDTSDPYGPMSGRNLVSIVDDLHEQLSEAGDLDTFTAATASLAGRSPGAGPTYCDLHCQGKHEAAPRHRHR